MHSTFEDSSIHRCWAIYMMEELTGKKEKGTNEENDKQWVAVYTEQLNITKFCAKF